MRARSKTMETVRVGPLMGIPSLLLSLGCRPEPIFDEAGLDLAQFEEPDNEISFVAGARLMANCVSATGCEHFALLLGEQAHPSSLGIAGFQLQSAPDVRTALNGLIRHLDLHDEGGVLSLTDEGDYMELSYVICLPEIDAQDQIYDLSAVLTWKIMRSLCGENWHPKGVFLSRKAPLEVRPYKDFFRAPIHFEADHCSLTFDHRCLGHKLPQADPLLFNHLEREATKLHARQSMTTTDQLRRLLRKSLPDGKLTNVDCARQLCMHERTLHRRLEEEGTSFRRVLDEMRFDVAQRLLVDTSMPLPEIAKAIGYGDTSAFVRSFKRWSSSTPAQWRSEKTPHH